MLRNIRITLAVISFTLITLLFLDFTGTLHPYLGWLAKIQFLPAVLALNVIIVLALVILTLIFGRIYCSVICPLGVMQDIFNTLRPKKLKRKFHREIKWLRYGMLAIFVVSIIAGISIPVSILAPYSSYGRMVQSILQPIVIYCNNLMAQVAESMNSYTVYFVEPRSAIGLTTIIAAVLFVTIAIIALTNGRLYCNCICPVGTILGLLSKFSWLKIHIDEDKCKNCNKCERSCKSNCINVAEHKVDHSRCVACGTCLKNCSFNALSYSHANNKNTSSDNTPSPDNHDESRRSFLIGTGIAIAGAAIAQEKKKVDGGLAMIEDKVNPVRNTPLTPAGSLSAKNLQQHCTACQLCISKCPNGVLSPSTDLATLMQPTMNYSNGYCRPECNACSSVCPTGAIRPITLDTKSSIQIGHAVWVGKNCLANTEGISCDNCSRHCPAGAITMVHKDGNEEKQLIPAINEARCIGCGACENLCPSRPFSAIYVEGHEVHKEI